MKLLFNLGDRLLEPHRVCSSQLAIEQRLAMAGLVVAVVLVPARLADGPWAITATLLCCCGALAFVLANRQLRGGRYTSVCLALLSAALLLEQGFTLVWGAANTIITGAFASFFAAQLYLVAGIRKVRSRHFMNGRVILDNNAYNAYQAAAGNQDSYRYHACLLSRSCCAAKPFSSPAAPPRC